MARQSFPLGASGAGELVPAIRYDHLSGLGGQLSPRLMARRGGRPGAGAPRLQRPLVAAADLRRSLLSAAGQRRRQSGAEAGAGLGRRRRGRLARRFVAADHLALRPVDRRPDPVAVRRRRSLATAQRRRRPRSRRGAGDRRLPRLCPDRRRPFASKRTTPDSIRASKAGPATPTGRFWSTGRATRPICSSAVRSGGGRRPPSGATAVRSLRPGPTRGSSPATSSAMPC